MNIMYFLNLKISTRTTHIRNIACNALSIKSEHYYQLHNFLQNSINSFGEYCQNFNLKCLSEKMCNISIFLIFSNNYILIITYDNYMY